MLSARFSSLYFHHGVVITGAAIDKIARTRGQFTNDSIDTVVTSFHEYSKGYFVAVFSCRLTLLTTSGAKMEMLEWRKHESYRVLARFMLLYKHAERVHGHGSIMSEALSFFSIHRAWDNEINTLLDAQIGEREMQCLECPTEESERWARTSSGHLICGPCASDVFLPSSYEDEANAGESIAQITGEEMLALAPGSLVASEPARHIIARLVAAAKRTDFAPDACAVEGCNNMPWDDEGVCALRVE